MLFLVEIFWAGIISSAFAIPAGVYVGKNGEVGASWGGYSASAGLGGSGTRGGLHAEAGTPDGHFAAAGLAGSVGEGKKVKRSYRGNKGVIYSVAKKPVVSVSDSHSSASSVSTSVAASGASSSTNVNDGHVHVVTNVNKRPHGSSFFDDVFNIPISVLGAVNRYLNNRKGGVHVSTNVNGGHYTTHVGGKPGSGTGTLISTNVNGGHVTTTINGDKPAGSQSQASSSAVSTSVSSGASSGASSSAGSGVLVATNIDNNIYHGHHTSVKHTGNYDDIFNIPVSVLGAVNRLLNNGKK